MCPGHIWFIPLCAIKAHKAGALNQQPLITSLAPMTIEPCAPQLYPKQSKSVKVDVQDRKAVLYKILVFHFFPLDHSKKEHEVFKLRRIYIPDLKNVPWGHAFLII